MVRFTLRLAALFALLCGPLLAMPAAAAPSAADGQACWAALPAAASPPTAAALAGADWRCRMRMSALKGERIAARFPPLAADGRPARYLRAGLGPFDRLTLIAQAADGTMLSASFRPGDTVPILGQPNFAAEFPAMRQPRALYAVIDRMGNGYTAKQMRTSADPPGAGQGERAGIALLAILVGMLVVPALIDLAIFRALRTPIFLYHALLTVCVAALVATWSGLLFEFAEVSMAAWYRLLMLGMGLTAAAACMFNRAFALVSGASAFSPGALRVAAGYCLAVTALCMAGLLDPVLPPGTFAYAFVPVLALLCATLFTEFRGGDGAARFQVAGWIPLLVFFCLQLAADFLSFRMPANGLLLLYAGVFIETVVSAIGVGMQFLGVRRERDTAMIRANVMGNLAERDHLTGLLNRRAIDTRFGDLRARGYDTVALIDLDHFKAINDVSGHAVGDQVLEITARVLASDPDNIAVRLGGEEFLILLRGTDPAARAEKLRRMLSVRVAREVDGLEQIVTASMGLLTLPPDNLDTLAFSSAYSRADLLLYEAKREGRNRTKSADWRFFDHAEADHALADGRDIRDRSVAAA